MNKQYCNDYGEQFRNCRCQSASWKHTDMLLFCHCRCSVSQAPLRYKDCKKDTSIVQFGSSYLKFPSFGKPKELELHTSLSADPLSGAPATIHITAVVPTSQVSDALTFGSANLLIPSKDHEDAFSIIDMISLCTMLNKRQQLLLGESLHDFDMQGSRSGFSIYYVLRPDEVLPRIAPTAINS